jgi:hypothetical protein
MAISFAWNRKAHDELVTMLESLRDRRPALSDEEVPSFEEI